jgi:hypothetical protein
MEGIGRVESGTETENLSEDYVEDAISSAAAIRLLRSTWISRVAFFCTIYISNIICSVNQVR